MTYIHALPPIEPDPEIRVDRTAFELRTAVDDLEMQVSEWETLHLVAENIPTIREAIEKLTAILFVANRFGGGDVAH